MYDTKHSCKNSEGNSMKIAESTYASILGELYDGLYITDNNRTITYWNSAAERITGFCADEVIGKSCSDNILTHVDEAGNSLCTGLCPLACTIKDSKSRETKIYLHHKDGHRIPVSVRVSPIRDEQGRIIGGVELFSDISSQKELEAELKELEAFALIDPLTQIPNRRYFDRQLEASLEAFKRFRMPFGFLFVDVDNFKSFNETYGHQTGDKVLHYVAKTIQGNIRSFDTASRWGGDEFCVLMHNASGKSLAELGNRLRMLIENSYITENSEKIHVTISLGGTVVQEGDTAATIIDRADRHLAIGKKSGKNLVIIS